jgi:ADP-ribose pyrophosphatase
MAEPEVLFQGKRFRVERVVQTADDGTQHAKEIVRHPGAVVILPLLDDGRICFVENYRASIGRRLVELPAGTLEPGEDPDETAGRELAEETGYRAGTMRRLLMFYMSPGVLDERMFFYVATSLESGLMHLDSGEDIRLRLATWEEALAMVRDGQIQDGKTIAGLLYYEKFGPKDK